jgi:hypothetical protein
VVVVNLPNHNCAMEVSYMEVSYIVYRVTKRFTTAGFNTLKAFFEHLLGSPIADFDET